MILHVTRLGVCGLGAAFERVVVDVEVEPGETRKRRRRKVGLFNGRRLLFNFFGAEILMIEMLGGRSF